jgi:MOSC domain-containing protein YiiM
MPMTTLQEVMDTLPQIGKLEWIGLRTVRRGQVESVKNANVIAGLGLEGDHRTQHKKPNPESKRQITLIQAEHIAAVASLVGMTELNPALTRRNLIVSSINLLALKDRQFFIGPVLLEFTGLCHPCTRMEENLGPGGYNAMRGHGGITARILNDGAIQVGDKVTVKSH